MGWLGQPSAEAVGYVQRRRNRHIGVISSSSGFPRSETITGTPSPRVANRVTTLGTSRKLTTIPGLESRIARRSLRILRKFLVSASSMFVDLPAGNSRFRWVIEGCTGYEGTSTRSKVMTVTSSPLSIQAADKASITRWAPPPSRHEMTRVSRIGASVFVGEECAKNYTSGPTTLCAIISAVLALLENHEVYCLNRDIQSRPYPPPGV